MQRVTLVMVGRALHPMNTHAMTLKTQGEDTNNIFETDNDTKEELEQILKVDNSIMLSQNYTTSIPVCWDAAPQFFGNGCLVLLHFLGKKKNRTLLTNPPRLLNKQKRNSDQRQLAPPQRYLKGKWGRTEQHSNRKVYYHFEWKEKSKRDTITLSNKQYKRRGRQRRLVHHKVRDFWDRKGRSVSHPKLRKHFWWEISDYILTVNTCAIRHTVWLTSCYQASNMSNSNSDKGQDKT